MLSNFFINGTHNLRTQPHAGNSRRAIHEGPTTHIPAPGELPRESAATIHPSAAGRERETADRRPPPTTAEKHGPTAQTHHPRKRTKPHPQRQILTSVMYPLTPMYTIYRRPAKQHSHHTRPQQCRSFHSASFCGRCILMSGIGHQQQSQGRPRRLKNRKTIGEMAQYEKLSTLPTEDDSSTTGGRTPKEGQTVPVSLVFFVRLLAPKPCGLKHALMDPGHDEFLGKVWAPSWAGCLKVFHRKARTRRHSAEQTKAQNCRRRRQRPPIHRCF